jgi:mono/diheme cytochrome c family protein
VRKLKRHASVACQAVIATVAVVLLATEMRAQQSGDAAQGRRDIVAYYCYSCHGYSAEGSDQGPRIDTNKWTQPNFMAYVRKGGRSMPKYGSDKQITDAALANIYAFLKSRPANPDPKSIPLLSEK